MRNNSQRLRRGLALCAIGLGVCVLAHDFGGRTAKADAIPDCASLSQHVVYISGSSAISPVISHLAYALAKAGDPLTIVADNSYAPPGSCGGLNFVLSTNMSGTSQYWPNDPLYDPDHMSSTNMPDALTASCNLPTSQRADIGASDVYPSSCPQPPSLAGFTDFDPGFVQAMEFIKPALENQTPNAISQEAAYLTFGFGADSTTEWHDPTKIVVRDESSGTMQMIARAMGVPANKVVKTNVAADTSSMSRLVQNGGVGAIGIMAATDAESSNYRTAVQPLAFQATGQTCAYWPNSTQTTLDKARVRDGHYPIWGRFHVVAPVTDGKPTNPDVARLIDILTGKEQVAGVNVLDLLILKSTIPECAMHVTRDSEMGPQRPFTPDKSCSCYFDSQISGGSSTCKACDGDADCTDAASPKCNHWGLANRGFCEAQ